MSDTVFKDLNIIAFVLAIILSVIAIVTDRQRFFVGLAVAGIIDSFALNLFTAALSTYIIKICTFTLILMFASKVFKKIAKR